MVKQQGRRSSRRFKRNKQPYAIYNLTYGGSMTTNDVGTEGEIRNIKWNNFDLHGYLEEMWNTV